MSNIIIFGGGETALLAYEYFTHDSNHTVVAFSMDADYIKENVLCGLPVISINNIKDSYPCGSFKAFVAVSSTKLNRVRKELYFRVNDLGYELVSYVSSRAFVWPNVEIGKNCFILENNVLQPFTKVGDNVVMWSGNHLGHRSVIKDHCFISSHCVISGFCEIGDSTFIGVNATLENNVIVGCDNFIGASALVRKSSKDKTFFQEGITAESKIDTHRLFKVKDE